MYYSLNLPVRSFWTQPVPLSTRRMIVPSGPSHAVHSSSLFSTLLWLPCSSYTPAPPGIPKYTCSSIYVRVICMTSHTNNKKDLDCTNQSVEKTDKKRLIRQGEYSAPVILRAAFELGQNGEPFNIQQIVDKTGLSRETVQRVLPTLQVTLYEPHVNKGEKIPLAIEIEKIVYADGRFKPEDMDDDSRRRGSPHVKYYLSKYLQNGSGIAELLNQPTPEQRLIICKAMLSTDSQIESKKKLVEKRLKAHMIDEILAVPFARWGVDIYFDKLETGYKLQDNPEVGKLLDTIASTNMKLLDLLEKTLANKGGGYTIVLGGENLPSDLVKKSKNPSGSKTIGKLSIFVKATKQ